MYDFNWFTKEHMTDVGRQRKQNQDMGSLQSTLQMLLHHKEVLKLRIWTGLYSNISQDWEAMGEQKAKEKEGMDKQLQQLTTQNTVLVDKATKKSLSD